MKGFADNRSTRPPGVYDSLSRRVVASVLTVAVTVGLLAYPFTFNAYGPLDNPFDRPVELAWIALMSVSAASLLIVAIYVRRALRRFAAQRNSIDVASLPKQAWSSRD